MANDDWEQVTMAPTWKPEKEGDNIVGVLARKEEHVGDNDSMLYTIESEEGSQMAVWGSTVLDNRMKNVEVGEEIKIVYKGRVQSDKRKGASYKNFDVYRRKTPFEKA